MNAGSVSATRIIAKDIVSLGINELSTDIKTVERPWDGEEVTRSDFYSLYF
jgi:hypothetical protein